MSHRIRGRPSAYRRRVREILRILDNSFSGQANLRELVKVVEDRHGYAERVVYRDVKKLVSEGLELLPKIRLSPILTAKHKGRTAVYLPHILVGFEASAILAASVMLFTGGVLGLTTGHALVVYQSSVGLFFLAALLLFRCLIYRRVKKFYTLE